MTVDVVVIGAGIQGLILTKKLRAIGASVACITNQPVGGAQTLYSQFYLHRGHFYRDINFARMLNNTYSHWVSLIQELKLHTTVNQSYVGFDSSEHEALWLDSWRKAALPFEVVDAPVKILEQGPKKSFYQFPHILFSGQSLIEGLSRELSHSFVLGKIIKIRKCSDDYYEIVFRDEKQQKTLVTKNIVFCAGSGNNKLIELISISDNFFPKIQKRKCQVLMLEGNLPNLSILMPGEQVFIAPQYVGKKTYWLYTFGTDPVFESDEQEGHNELHLRQQIRKLFELFPTLHNRPLNAFVYTATKIESADLGKGARPNQAYIYPVAPGILSVWPTKLSLAFEAAEEVIRSISLTSNKLLLEKQPCLVPHKSKRITLNNYL